MIGNGGGDGGGSGGSVQPMIIPFLGGASDYSDLPAPLDTDTTLTNGEVKQNLFAEIGPTKVYGIFKTPSNLDLAGNVIINFEGKAAAVIASKNIALEFLHSIANPNIDTVYTTVPSGDLAVSAVDNDVNYLSFSVSVATLGWVASKVVRYEFQKVVASLNNLAGDFEGLNGEIVIPRA